MLLSVYGMRCGEIVYLSLDDIDWENELLYLKRSKLSKPQVFPLVKDVGEAVLNYIKAVRWNKSKSRQIFMGIRYPHNPINNSTIYQIVSKKLKKLNVNLKHYGPHVLRHTSATYLINNGISLKEISDYLGHKFSINCP